jgi:2'-5' RNA ligase
MPDVELARREGIELVKTGSWATMSGSWNPSPEDLAAAVEAQSCPGVRRPVVKLGHVDSRFDGEPALGWFENLRLADGGSTLVGDQVTLPWLNSVQAAAYPSRSVEGNYNHTCGAGHRHKFVLTAVALLGVTPPAVKTIRNLNDLPAMLGVAASQDVPEGAEHVQVTILAGGEEHTGAMVALIPTVEDAARLAVDGGEPAEELHVTLRYLGEADQIPDRARARLVEAVARSVSSLPPFDADAFSIAVFNPGRDDKDPCITLGVSGTLVEAAHDLVASAVDDVGVEMTLDIPSPHRPFHAHLTLGYTPDLGKVADWADRVGPVRFDRARVAFGGTVTDIPLVAVDQAELLVPNILMPVAAAAGDNLRKHWLHGEGAAEIRWGTEGDFGRCVRKLREHVRDPEGLCAEYHHEATGMWPGNRRNRGVKASAEPPIPDLPAAEPEQPITDPKEDFVSTELSGLRSRLGLSEDADLTAIEAKVDELKADAEKTPEPTPEMVAASAAATEAVQRAETAQAEMKAEIARLSGELTEIKASAATSVKASLFDGAVQQGKIKPADRESWEGRYDKAPDVITEILASIAPGTAVPVMASGTVGAPEPNGSDDDWDDLVARLDGPNAKAV